MPEPIRSERVRLVLHFEVGPSVIIRIDPMQAKDLIRRGIDNGELNGLVWIAWEVEQGGASRSGTDDSILIGFDQGK